MPKTARKVPRINVWSRHADSCEHRDDRTYTRCGCPKQLQWYYQGREYRQSADTNQAEVAERRARQKEKDYECAAYGTPAPEPSKPATMLLSEAIALFLAAKERRVQPRHFLKLRFEFERRMLRHFTGEGLLLVSDISLLALERWEATWTGKLSSRKQRRIYISEFFKWAVKHDLIAKNPCDDLEIGGKDDSRATQPLTEDQFNRLLEATRTVNGRTTDEQRTKLHALLRLMRWSGLAIRDALSLERNRLRRDSDGWYRLFLRRTKTKTDVYCTLPPDVAEELLALPAAQYFFIDALPTGQLEMDRIVKLFQYLFKRLEEAVRLKEEDGEGFHSHRLRDTFAVWCLNQDMSIEDVAKLLGHTNILTTQKHYSPWCRERAERLASRMKEAYAKWESRA